VNVTPLWPLAAVFGALIGSFLNVVIWRVPRGESLSHPGSHCPNCNHTIRWFDNIPVISWLVLRGRCRDCGSRISARYPLVELVTAASFAAVTVWWGSATTVEPLASVLFGLVAYLYLASISIALCLIDIDVHRLPNTIVFPSYVVLVVLIGAASLVDGDYWSLARAAIGGVGLFAFYFILAVAYPGGMGFGDVKLSGVLGFALAWLGFGTLAVGAFAAFLIGGVFGVLLLLVRRAGRKTRIPFGPWMLGGAWIGIFAGEAIAQWYLSIFGLA
jgi:leader peptidase (prepilin peptidase)/N-methyltransferase